ncbi:MAG TPA: sensor histidine kinase [Bacteroidetes bacterium]|nr:sensor histidine kinase [Bacteroidota bacterium]
MFKNLTPRQISAFAAIVISGIIFLMTIFSELLGFTQIALWILLSSPIIFFIISYFVILFFLEKFIYRKIKLIYKNIHQFKRSSKEKINLLSTNETILDTVSDEVAAWAIDNQKEIENLKSLENYRRNFIGNISHELKTPIFNIQGYVHTLLDGGLKDKKINKKFLKKAAKNADRLQTIVEDLDAIAKLESGELVMDIQDFGIRKLTVEIFEELEIMAAEKNIKLMLKDGAAQDFQVKADRENIGQVLINLITNSIKYGRKGGYTKVGFYDMDQYILVEVADNGIGISEQHLNHLFDRFYRVDKSRSRNEGGSGLGLSIVKHIIEAHKQTVNVRSTKKLGSTFGFTLEKA